MASAAVSDSQFDLLSPTSTPAQYFFLTLCVRICSLLSLLATSGAIAAFIFWPRFRSTASRIVLCLAIADFIDALAKTVSRDAFSSPQGFLCQSQAAIIQFATLSSVLWSMTVALNLVHVVLLTRQLKLLRWLTSKASFYICFGVPLLVACVPFVVKNTSGIDGYGTATLWCWITYSYPLLQYSLWFLPLWSAFLAIFFIYISLGFHLWFQVRGFRRDGVTTRSQYRFTYAKKVSLYLLVFIIVWSPSSITRIYAIRHGGQSLFMFDLLLAILSPLRGFLNATIYSYITLFSRISRTDSRPPLLSMPAPVFSDLPGTFPIFIDAGVNASAVSLGAIMPSDQSLDVLQHLPNEIWSTDDSDENKTSDYPMHDGGSTSEASGTIHPPRSKHLKIKSASNLRLSFTGSVQDSAASTPCCSRCVSPQDFDVRAEVAGHGYVGGGYGDECGGGAATANVVERNSRLRGIAGGADHLYRRSDGRARQSPAETRRHSDELADRRSSGVYHTAVYQDEVRGAATTSEFNLYERHTDAYM